MDYGWRVWWYVFLPGIVRDWKWRLIDLLDRSTPHGARP